MTKIVLSLIVFITYLFGVNIGYTNNSDWTTHLLFPFSHANIFHLLCNIIALYALKGKLAYIPAFIISLVSSYLPFASIDIPTMGASGIIFALIGMNWGAYFCKEFYNTRSQMLTRNLKRFGVFIILPMIICFFIPNINVPLHLYTLILGLSYPFILYYVKRI